MNQKIFEYIGIYTFSSHYDVVVLWKVDWVCLRCGLSVAFKSRLGAVWGRSLSSIALRYESWGCPVQYIILKCKRREAAGGGGRQSSELPLSLP